MGEILRDWTTQAGLRAVLVQHYRGHICGYVAVAEGHPLHGVHYDEEAECLRGKLPEVMEGTTGKRGIITILCAAVDKPRATMDLVFDVHGSVTYTGKGERSCLPKENGVWWIGFDTAHCDDNPEDCNESYCANECERLAAQIAEVHS